MIYGEPTKLFTEEIPNETGNEQLGEKSEIEREKNKRGGGKEGLQCWHFLQKDTQLFPANTIQGRFSLSYKETL